MAKKPKSIKLDKIEIKDHRNVSFTVAFILVLIAFTAGVLAYKYFFMILPTKPGCVNVFLKTAGGDPIPNSKVRVYPTGTQLVTHAAVVIERTGEELGTQFTGPGGKATFCGIFEPNSDYGVLVYDQEGNMLWGGVFRTNERGTADIPMIVRP